MKQATLTNIAKECAEDLHHEARFEIITEIIERYINVGWMDGFAEGYEQGRSLLVPVDEVQEAFQNEFKQSLSDATGHP
jgi:hypothetical protein